MRRVERVERRHGTRGVRPGRCVLVLVFVLAESRAPTPITPLHLFANRNRSASYVARLLLVGGLFGMFFFLTQFLQDVLHYSPVRSGLAFLPLTVALFVASQLSARALCDRLPSALLTIGGLLLSTTGLLWLTQLSATSNYLSLLGPLVLFGTGLAFVPLTTASLAGVEPADAGAASGLINVTQQVGGALGLAVLVSVFGASAGGQRRGHRHALSALAELCSPTNCSRRTCPVRLPTARAVRTLFDY